MVPLKRKSEVTDKEVLNLTRGLFPLKIVDGAKQVILTLIIEQLKISNPSGPLRLSSNNSKEQ